MEIQGYDTQFLHYDCSFSIARRITWRKFETDNIFYDNV
jgi:hypothetical protein